MSFVLRNRVIVLALILLVGQLTLAVHTTVHDDELSCHICRSQSNDSNAIPSIKLYTPITNNQDDLFAVYKDLQPTTKSLRVYLQRAPPVTH